MICPVHEMARPVDDMTVAMTQRVVPISVPRIAFRETTAPMSMAAGRLSNTIARMARTVA